jgi:HAD superfamily hydrolase (TIGR01490 family)
MSEPSVQPPAGGAAAFFDVDGTLLSSNIVHYYAYFRRRRMSRPVAAVWHGLFALKCLYFLLLDRVDRSRLNVVFYRGYRGMRVADLEAIMPECHRDVIVPRLYPAAADCVAGHVRAGRRVVLVTGSIDFIMAPLAKDLGAAHVLAPGLVRAGEVFTGDLSGPPLAEAEKARRMQRLAEAEDIDLAGSYAYGDSIADLAMLEAVGHPQAVNPDSRLAALAASRGWPVHRWTLGPRAT